MAGDVRDFIGQFEVLVFDMGDTFMFGCDRFADEHDLHTTYRSLGGAGLTSGELNEAVKYVYAELFKVARDESRYASFPAVSDFMTSDLYFKGFGRTETDLIEQVFARHECGHIPDSSVVVLNRLAQSHALGLISNVWSDSAVFKARFREAAIEHLFEVMVFSSEYGAIKPDRLLFEKVGAYFNLPFEKLVYIGNNYKRDVVGAKSVGMKAILVDNGPASEITGDIQPDRVIGSIQELV